jgi:DNA polymerase-3 subunit alpha
MHIETIHSFKKKNYWVGSHNSDISDRDKVIEKLREFFGYENVVPISNYNTFKVKSLVKDVSKFYGIPFNEVNDALKTVEDSVRKAITKHGDDKNLFVLKYDEALQYDERFRKFIEKHPEVGESVNVLFKQNRSLGRHAGGVLISDDLVDKMPLITSKGEPQSPFVEGVGYKHLEKIGNFCKYDLLGLETLRLIERSIEQIIENAGLVEIEVANNKYRLLKSDKVQLTDGTFVSVSDLKESDDIIVPIKKL